MSDILTNAVRLLAAQFRNKGGELGAAAATVFDLLGEDGDPHEATARINVKEAAPADTTRGKVSLDRALHDINYHPGKGFTYSDHRSYDWSRAAEKAGMPDKLHRRFIPEGEIVGMAREAAAHRELEAARDRWLEDVDNRAARHSGFDTRDAGKDSMYNVSDDHHIDTSESSAHLSVIRGDTWLNGSQVKHRACVGMEIKGPDGRTLVRVSMSFDQFASFLTSQGMTPCTITDYWSMNESNVRLHERVRPVDTVGERLGRRIKSRIDEEFSKILQVAKQLEDASAAGKPINKTLSAKLAEDIRRAADYTCQNLTFAGDQAQEEIAGIIEQAAVHMSLSFGVNLDLLRAHPMLSTLGVEQPRLPAPTTDCVGGIGPSTDGA